MELLLSYLHLFKTEGEVIQPLLLKNPGLTVAQLKGLVIKIILIVDKRSVDRIKAIPKSMQVIFDLSEAQQKALAELQEQFHRQQCCLLHGITSSGKTQVLY
jgi:primosomal protein N' (replication factor Y)